ncbi:DUF2637 domain-containing protein [Streptomyces sp. NPDC048172]|uniref:DUF2637 domain-containing protein n=1 Tax=Streptomyces sp. NPDC048172 TaxID=3365505 RepID=UPI00371D0145
MTYTDAIPVRITGWDRAAIVSLGAAGCALSYDALQQMAVAIHIRGLLTYLFPLVIDGFIGYGVRAVLVMRSASLGARCYVWALFGTATAASIWANALHAVRLNDQPGGGGLRLGDVTVGVLSTLAPLALAGAVHLYILIARRAATEAGHPVTAGAADTAVRAERISADAPDTPAGHRSRAVAGEQLSALSAGATGHPADTLRPDNPSGEPVTEPEAVLERQDEDTAVSDNDPDARPGHGERARPRERNASVSDAPSKAPSSSTGTENRPKAGDADELLALARRAVTDAGKLTRKVVADAVRGEGLSLSNDRLTELMQQLRAEADNHTLRSTG